MLIPNKEISKELFISRIKNSAPIYEKVAANIKTTFYRLDGSVYYSSYSIKDNNFNYYQVISNKSH